MHFIHVRSKNPNALPLLITHGWPGSVFERVRTDGLTDRTRGVDARTSRLRAVDIQRWCFLKVPDER
ncbi:epoxide hydrolase N-terminal domain-containing protein [Nostoc sp. DedQUE12b]|uniref:epoxide hydrolase N-terminal domain-containing protein n=1 Tax=Nostoc sp. DedQUE12b TaxID=3075398 RepID=UPI003A0FF6C2